MKVFFKNILGKKIIRRLREVFPSAVQREAEKREIQRKAAFYSSFIKTGDICFDVGANVGNRIAPLLQIGAKIIAVEPQKKCYRILKQKFGKRIQLVRKGLGETERDMQLYISADSTISSFSSEWISAVKGSQRFKEKEWDKVDMIAMTTVDNLIKDFGLPAFIKIDVEGYELEVLKGLTKAIGMISFEYTVPEQPRRAIECLDQITRYNPFIECNYSIGEDLVWTLPGWLPAEKMKEHILTDEFNSTSFGDIYVRTKPSQT